MPRTESHLGTLVSQSSSQTEHFAASFAKLLQAGDCLALSGELGSGKTTWVRGLARGLKLNPSATVHSPTFSLVNEYPGKEFKLIHFDLYRLKDSRELSDIAFYDYLGGRQNVIVVEWAERLPISWPNETYEIEFDYVLKKNDQRQLTFKQCPKLRRPALLEWMAKAC